MQNIPKLTLSQFCGILAVVFVGAAMLVVLPAGAQVDQTPAESEPPAEQNAEENQADDPQDVEPQPADDSEQAAEPEPPPATEESAQELLDRSRKLLLGRMYQAKIVQKLIFKDRNLEAQGRILRGGKEFQLRLEFQIQSGGTVGELLQVCDGDVLWTQRRVNDSVRLTRQEVKLILKTAAQTDSISQNMLVTEMGLGGVASLLASLERTMVFEAPQTETVDEEPLRRLDGQWNAEFMAQVQANPQLAKGLPEHVPDAARVYFDRNDFPRRIQYLKIDPDHEVLLPMVTLDFLDVEWLTEADVKPADFEFKPPEGVYQKEVTEEYIKLLQPPSAPAAPSQ